MIRRRARPDGLPFRVYERFGARVYSIGYKADDNTWTFRLQCPVSDARQIAQLRRDATKRAADLNSGMPAEGTFGALADAWLQWQQSLPAGSRRAESTLAENTRELAMLKRAFGPVAVADLQKRALRISMLNSAFCCTVKERISVLKG